MARDALDMTGFTDRSELEAFRYREGAFYLGAIHPDHGVNFEAGIRDDRHLFVVAGSRSGKGTSLIIPNLIRWPGGVLCIDPKGENASITGMRRARREDALKTGTSVREFLGQHVAILDPLGEVRGPARKFQVTYDPLGDIAVTSAEASGQIYAAVEAVVLPEQGGEHWTDSAGCILAGIIEAVLILEPRERHSFAHIRRLLGQGFDEVEALLKRCPATPAGLAQEAAALLDDTTGDELSGFKSTLRRQLRWVADPRMQKHLAPGSFSLRRAVQENWTIYVVIPPRLIPRFKRWMRLIVNVSLDAKMASPLDHQGHPMLFVLDEFSSLGHFALIEDGAASMAGYGIKLMPVIQNMGQVKRDYPKNWETFLGNAGAICAFGLNDHETEEYIANRMGRIMVWERSYGESRQTVPLFSKATGPNGSTSENTAVHERFIRWPNEIHNETSRTTGRMYVIRSDGPPISILRSDYNLASSLDFESPDAIRHWEQNHASNS